MSIIGVLRVMYGGGMYCGNASARNRLGGWTKEGSKVRSSQGVVILYDVGDSYYIGPQFYAWVYYIPTFL